MTVYDLTDMLNRACAHGCGDWPVVIAAGDCTCCARDVLDVLEILEKRMVIIEPGEPASGDSPP